MCEDIQKCCRICLDVVSEHVSILGDPTISLHMKSCLSVVVSPNDHLPKKVCSSCVSSLNQFYNFQVNARCSQDWLESSVQEKLKKTSENKMVVQPLPDSEYNSDSLLEFLNNTANIEEYLNNLGKEDIPCIVNMMDRNEHNMEVAKTNNVVTMVPSPMKKDTIKKFKMEVMETDVPIVKGVLVKDGDPKIRIIRTNCDHSYICFGCKTIFDSVQQLLHHMSICDLATRTCVHCDVLFNSRLQMLTHSIVHNTSLPLTCNCSEQFLTKERLIQHHKTCHTDYAAAIGCVYRCKECGDTFKERFQLYKHAKEHIIKLEEKVCDICGHTFIGSDSLNNHRMVEHQKPANAIYKCKICHATSTDRKEMFLHVKKHSTKAEPMRHLCESCGRSFVSPGSLLRHSLLHRNRKIVCTICNEKFLEKRLLDAHMKEHIELVICEKCGQSVISYKLNLHTCV